MRYAWVAALLFLGVFAGVYSSPETALAPGAWITAHQKEGLSCFDCHQPFRGPQGELCAECHRGPKLNKATEGQPRLRFHHDLKAKTCLVCHREHQGPQVKDSIEGFTHQYIPDQGKNNCLQCHQKPQNQPHEKAKDSCLECHDQKTWKTDQFAHDSYFWFDEDHQDCKSCHLQGKFKSYSCFGCHSDSSIARGHWQEDIHDCANCHPSSKLSEARTSAPVRKPGGPAAAQRFLSKKQGNP